MLLGWTEQSFNDDAYVSTPRNPHHAILTTILTAWRTDQQRSALPQL